MCVFLDHDFCSDVGYWLHMAAHRFERSMNAELASEGLTYRQCQVLGWLALDGPLAQVDLAERMNVEPPTLVRVLDGMEQSALIERTECATDRRRKVVRPTDRARPIWEKIVVCANRVRDRAIRGMTPEEQETLRSSLSRLHDNLEDEIAKTPLPGPLRCESPRRPPGVSRP